MPGTARKPWLNGQNRATFLNHAAGIGSAAAWNDPALPKLWLYQLHYFDDLCAARAAERSTWHRPLMARWIRENPVGEGVGWDPYPTSVRIANWVKWQLAGNALDHEALESLATQVRWLEGRLEYHLLANHLLENLKALTLAGCFFDGPEGDAWRARGLAGLQREVREQVLKDGGHCELSPMYHGLALEGLLDIANALQAYELEVPRWLTDSCVRMVAWASAMTHPDGDWAQLNDTSLEYSARSRDLAAYAARLGLPDRAPDCLVLLEQSGFARASCGELTLFCDVGGLGPEYNPAHGHADTLCYELSHRGERLIVDPGVSTYEDNGTRAWERSTAAHNTVTIDGQSSSEVWAAFRVARRARVFNVRASGDSRGCRISAEHDGYARLGGAPKHHREWRLSRKSLEVRDSVVSTRTHALTSRIGFHPRYSVRAAGGDAFEISDSTGAVIGTLDRGTWASARVEPFAYAPQWGRIEPATCVIVTHHETTRELCYSLTMIEP